MTIPIAKPVGLKGIAEQAGVSVATVSMALANHPNVNENTKRRIRDLSRQLGYRRLRKAPEPRSSSVRVGPRMSFVLLGGRLEDEVHLGVLHSLTTAATTLGGRMEVQAIEDISDQTALVDRVLESARSLDGLILSGYVERNLMIELENARVPHVVFGHPMFETTTHEGVYGQVIASDEVAMGELAVHSFVKAGHRRISFICELAPKGLWAARWLRGYRLGLSESQIEADPRLIQIAGQNYVGGDRAADALFAMTDPATAFVIPDVRVASAFFAAARARGKAISPQSVIIGGQQALLNRYNVEHLPWIAYDHDQLAAVALRQLCQIAQQPMPCVTELLVPFKTRNLPAPIALSLPNKQTDASTKR
jgi:DNA-binding LacI/PurR family transcriptional regulator